MELEVARVELENASLRAEVGMRDRPPEAGS